MNAIGVALIWCVLQVTIATVVGGIVYFIAHRAGRAAARLAVSATLTTVLILTATMLSPWPSWLDRGATISRNDSRALDDSPSVNSAANSVANSEESDAQPQVGPTPADNTLNNQTSFWRTFLSELGSANAASDDSNAIGSWRWPEIFAICFAVAAALGLLRFAFASFALRKLARTSHHVESPGISALIDELHDALEAPNGAPVASTTGNSKPLGSATTHSDGKIASKVTVLETSACQTAATFGWRRPVILLPIEWRDWSREELRAVLAHEVAHIRAGDFVMQFFAQIAVAIHFFHPLVHWLARRLRLEQELAADASAAALAGGRTNYLKTLAAHTLRADHIRFGWAAQTFLPTRSMFVRRIEMLKRAKSIEIANVSSLARVTVVLCAAMTGLLISGLRGPMANEPRLGAVESEGGQEVQPDKKVVFKPSSDLQPDERAKVAVSVDMMLIPEDAILVYRFRPAEILGGDDMRAAVDSLGDILVGQPFWFKRPIDALTTIMMSPHGDGVRGAPRTARLVFRGVQPIGPADFTAKWIATAEKAEHAVMPYFHEKGDPNGDAYLQFGQHIMIFDSASGIRMLLDRFANSPKPPRWLGDAQPGNEDSMWVAFNMARLRAASSPRERTQLVGGMPMQMVGPLLNETKRIVGSMRFEKKLSIQVTAECDDSEAAKRVNETAEAAIVLARNVLAEQRRVFEGRPMNSSYLRLASGMIEELLKSTTVTADGDKVNLVARSERDVTEQIKLLISATHSARQAARRNQSQNNLKHIALAMQNYESAHGHFPPSVLHDKETGTPYSWRVAILPFLEQNALHEENSLYEKYRFDEPWDSEHNMQIAKTVVPIYASPTEPESTNAAYYVLTGEETVFAGKDGVKLRDIRDGMSRTLLVVEAKRDVPWTKPDDIPYAHDKPLPNLGGFFDGGINAARCDGSVEFFEDAVADAALRKLIEKSDEHDDAVE